MSRAALPALLLGAAVVACAAPIPKENDIARMHRIYGAPADPKDDARFEMYGDALRVFSPARKLQATGSPWTPTSVGASRVWQPMTGDFTVVVRVSFNLRKAKEQEVWWWPRVAGVVVWVDEKNHFAMFRCEELANRLVGKQEVREAFQSILTHPRTVRTSTGQLQNSGNAAFLRVKRIGKLVFGAYSRDGKKWNEFIPDDVEWGDTVKVGVYVKHFSETAFETVFDQYTLAATKK